MGHGHRPARLDLRDEARQHAAVGAEHVAEADRAHAGASPEEGEGRYVLADQLADPLRRAHHVRGAHRLVGGDVQEVGHHVLTGQLEQVEGAGDVRHQGFPDVAFGHGHVFHRGGVDHQVDLPLLEQVAEVLRLADVGQHGREIGIAVVLQPDLDLMEMGVVLVEQEQVARREPRELTHEFRTDGAAGARYQDHLPLDEELDARQIDVADLPADERAEQVIRELLLERLAREQFLHGGESLHLHVVLMDFSRDGRLLRGRQRGDREVDLVQVQGVDPVSKIRSTAEHLDPGVDLAARGCGVVEEADEPTVLAVVHDLMSE